MLSNQNLLMFLDFLLEDYLVYDINPIYTFAQLYISRLMVVSCAAKQSRMCDTTVCFIIAKQKHQVAKKRGQVGSTS